MLHNSIIPETFGPLPRILVLGHGGHGKGTFCKMLHDETGLLSLSSSAAAWPLIWPAFDQATGFRYDGPKVAYANRAEHRDLFKALISLYNTPGKTALTRLVLSQASVYDGMRCAEEFEAARNWFDCVVWVDASERVELDSSMGIACPPGAEVIYNNDGPEELFAQVREFASRLRPNGEGGLA